MNFRGASPARISSMKEFTHQFIAGFTQLDYARAMAFVAFDEATNEMVGPGSL
jgi:hypothetical protein